MGQGASDIRQTIFGEGEKVYYAEGNELKIGEVLNISPDGDIKISSEFTHGLLTRHEKQVLVVPPRANGD
ncbi:hypothetical protein [Streptomyces misionensis]|uniref:hypothetical protein n=1 Tax=Streptomyces misionensis TaxID=67331 RepID=UPI0033BCF290